MTIDVPLDLLNIPGNAVVVNEYPANISVQVQGPRTLLRSLTTRGIRRTIDLTDIGVGLDHVSDTARKHRPAARRRSRAG